jgi:hypothetical protein
MLKYIALNRNLIEDMNMLIYNFKVKNIDGEEIP